jgi:uncharacterized membrane protein HdeD (DUF308 family)
MMEPMESPTVHHAIVRNWGFIALRGVLALLFGVLTLLQPGIALLALLVVFGVFALVDGALLIGAAVARRGKGRHWVTPLLGGLLGIGIGVLTLLSPGVTALALLFLIAAWAIVRGTVEIATAYRLRKQITGEGALMAAGVLSVVFGVVVAIFPGAGALGIVLWIGAWATLSGILLLVVAFQLRSWGREHDLLAG